eukprot:750989-Hanusia_phi.AAC.4
MWDREVFKRSKEAEDDKAVEAEDDAFAVLKLLTEQRQLQLSSRWASHSCCRAYEEAARA